MQKTDHLSEQVSYYRFWKNDNVTETGLIELAGSHCIEQCQSVEHILLLQDTTELNLESHRGRIKDKSGLGLVGNNTDLGFFCHPTIAINAKDGALLGALDIHLWHRDEDKENKDVRQYKKLPIEEKESYRWAERAIEANRKLPDKQHLTVVQDREGDIYESFCLLKEAGLNFVVRNNHNRTLAFSTLNLKEYISELLPAYECVMEVRGENKQRKKREAHMEIRYTKASLSRPGQIIHNEKYPPDIEVYVVHVKEKQDSVPKGEKPIEWTLFTTHLVTNLSEALLIIKYYRMRWNIEDLFRTVKSEGVNYENSELESGKALRKLFVMALMAAIQILQLRQARSGETIQKPSLIFSNKQIECLESLLLRFEGKTEKQKNPHNKDNLAWATWIIARLGGWKGYASQRPPGVITLHDGWLRFQNLFDGWLMHEIVYRR